jgi:hypothetical protein
MVSFDIEKIGTCRAVGQPNQGEGDKDTISLILDAAYPTRDQLGDSELDIVYDMLELIVALTASAKEEEIGRAMMLNEVEKSYNACSQPIMRWFDGGRRYFNRRRESLSNLLEELEIEVPF